MEIPRQKIYAGVVYKQNGFSLTDIRKILFYKSIEDHFGKDLINLGVRYPTTHDNKYRGYFITGLINLNPILQMEGYPTFLTHEDIARIMGDDSYKIFVESGILRRLHRISDENMLPNETYIEVLKIYIAPNVIKEVLIIKKEFIKNEFIKRECEKGKTYTKQKINRF